MRIGRRLSLSTHAPITNPKSRAGRTPAAVSADIWTGVASRVRIAVNWSAPNTEPVTDMVCADHSFRKSTFHHRLLSLWESPGSVDPLSRFMNFHRIY